MPATVTSGFGAEVVSDVDGLGEPPALVEGPRGLNELTALLRAVHALPRANARR